MALIVGDVRRPVKSRERTERRSCCSVRWWRRSCCGGAGSQPVNRRYQPFIAKSPSREREGIVDGVLPYNTRVSTMTVQLDGRCWSSTWLVRLDYPSKTIPRLSRLSRLSLDYPDYPSTIPTIPTIPRLSHAEKTVLPAIVCFLRKGKLL